MPLEIWKLKEGEEFELDGSEHTKGDCWCFHDLDKCPKCGHSLHYQAVYGGYIEECDNCPWPQKTEG